MPKQFFCEGREPNFKFGSAISSLWLRHKLAVEKSAHQCDFSTFLHSEALCSEDNGRDGLGYTLGRIHMDSCDFSVSNYCAVEDPASPHRCTLHRIPFIFPFKKRGVDKSLINPNIP